MVQTHNTMHSTNIYIDIFVRKYTFQNKRETNISIFKTTSCVVFLSHYFAVTHTNALRF